VSQDQVDIIGWMDLTKFGVLSQKDVNKIGAWCEKILAKNPTGSLSISLFLIGCAHDGGVEGDVTNLLEPKAHIW